MLSFHLSNLLTSLRSAWGCSGNQLSKVSCRDWTLNSVIEKKTSYHTTMPASIDTHTQDLVTSSWAGSPCSLTSFPEINIHHVTQCLHCSSASSTSSSYTGPHVSLSSSLSLVSSSSSSLSNIYVACWPELNSLTGPDGLKDYIGFQRHLWHGCYD